MSTVSFSETGRDSPLVFAPNSEPEEWVFRWRSVLAQELVDGPVIAIDADTDVEEACEVLLSKDVSCIAIRSQDDCATLTGLFDFADLNAFLTLAATQHTLTAEDLQGNSRVEEIVNAAKAGKVPVHLVSNLSEKNPLEVLPHTSTIVEILAVFAQGTHRVLIRLGASESPAEYAGTVSDRSLLSYFHRHAQQSTAFSHFLSNPLHSLYLPSLNLRSAVVYCSASKLVIDAMKSMSEQGVSSVAIVKDSQSVSSMPLLSAVSVTDIGKIVVPSQSKQILSTPLHQFIARIKVRAQTTLTTNMILKHLRKAPDGSTDGADKYPVYSVSAASSLRYTIEKILATNAHRVFVTEDNGPSVSPTSSSPPPLGNLSLRGVVSIVDVLSLFARLANIPDVDPTRMQRHRRMSSASASSLRSGR